MVIWWVLLVIWWLYYFISSCTTIYLFVKKFVFSNVYISVNAIFECHYMFFGWERGHQPSTYTTVGIMGVIQNAYTGRRYHALCVRTDLHYLFSCFWQHFCLIVSSFIRRNLTFMQKRCVVRNGYLSLTRSISVVMK